MIFDQQETAVALHFELRHIAFDGSQPGQYTDAISKISVRLQRLAIGCRYGFLPRPDKTIQSSLAKNRTDALDQADGKISVRVREPPVALRGQPPHPFRTTDFARPVVERYQILAMQRCEVLSHADFGDAEGGREGARAQRTPRLERVEDPIAVVRAHVPVSRWR